MSAPRVPMHGAFGGTFAEPDAMSVHMEHMHLAEHMQAEKTSACLAAKAAKAVLFGTDSAGAQSLETPMAAMVAMCPSCGFANRLAGVLGRCCSEGIYPSLAASRSGLLPC